MDSLHIEKTDDGSSTLYLPRLDEHYHSVKGARTEALHVYIETAFGYCRKKDVCVLEIGFGTGLNAFLTQQAAGQQGRRVHYVSLELYPLEWELVAGLGYTTGLEKEQAACFESLHAAAWDRPVEVSSDFILYKIRADLRSYVFTGPYDVVYFDAFAPDKQPGLWEEEIFGRIYRSMSAGAVLSTYCAKGEVRRRMQRAGFSVERLPGPPGGKREILRACRPPVSE